MIGIVDYNSDANKEILKKILNRNQLDYGNVNETVNDIISNVRNNGDDAVFEYTLKFDGFELNKKNILVTEEEIKKAYSLVDKDLLDVIRKAKKRITDFHQKQKLNSWFEPSKTGEILGQLIQPVQIAGVYVPGGKAAYPSSVLMNILPAKVAGVEKIVMTTPPNKEGDINPTTIVAACEAGITQIYKVGGAQAIAAMAFGTESIPKVDKIVGPGNIFVALAKKNVFGYVSIDSVAGPSEILIVADSLANPVYLAADMLSQAEHDELASSILITNDKKIAEQTKVELEKQTAKLERKDIIEKSLSNFGAIIVCNDIDQAFDICNEIAPEHLEVCVSEPFSHLSKIKNAGAIFLGHFTPEPLGDYMAGPNHVLPTGATAKFFSPLSVDDFIKKSSILSFSKNSMLNIANDVITFANAEGLTAHANSVKIRLSD